MLSLCGLAERMEVSRHQIEYMCVNERGDSGMVRMRVVEVAKAEEFKYLGSTVQRNGGSTREVNARWSDMRQKGTSKSESEGLQDGSETRAVQKYQYSYPNNFSTIAH